MKVNISTVDGMKEVEAVDFINIGGQKCFMHKEAWDELYHKGFTWKVSEYRSGWFFGTGSTKKFALADAKSTIKNYGVERFKEKIEDAIKKTGVANS